MINPYDYMSMIYDSLIDDVNYKLWQQEIEKLVAKYQIKGLNVLEIGAGSGNMTELLLEEQFKVTAVEPSAAMLSILQEKLNQQMGHLQFFQGDIFTFKTKKSYDMAFAFLDVINYIKREELPAFFMAVRKHLSKDGYFLFDFSTEYKLKNIIGNSVFAEEHEDFAFIWENFFDEQQSLLEFNFTMFTEEEHGLYLKQRESHRQYVHRIEGITAAAEPCFSVVEVWGDDFQPLQRENQRQHMLLKCKGE